MAILVQEEKKSVNWLFIGSILGAFVAIAVLMYFVFFSQAPLIEITNKPSNYDTTSSLSKVSIDVEGITSNPVWRSLSHMGVPAFTPPETSAPKNNPFELSF